MNIGVYLSLGFYFSLMLAIGVYGYFTTAKDVAGFMLGGRKLSPAVTALSAGASDMSGWMLLGLPGLIFVTGISGSLIAIGLIVGAYLNYRLIAPRLRIYTEMLDDAMTIPEYLERRFHDNSHVLRTFCALVIIIFFAIYTTSGLVAGGKLFESSFGTSYEIGIFITAGVVVAYSTFGGFAAVSTTDFVQGCIMLIALILVPCVTVMEIGGWLPTQASLISLNPEMLKFNDLSILAVISALAWGLGYFGQPHIIVRFMAISSVNKIGAARRIGMTWMIFSIVGTISVGLSGAAYIYSKGLMLADPETIFIFLANTLFHPLVAGFLLAAILAAIMSTISSQLLVASSSITEDIYHTFLRRNSTDSERLVVGRLSIVLVALLAFGLAYNQNHSILSLVSNAWAGFGAAFGPVVLISLFWARMTVQGALAGIVSGAITVLLWLYLPIVINGESLSSFLYEIVPGFVISSVAIVVVSLVTTKKLPLIENHIAMELELHRRMSP
ncbi:MAG: SSS family solute:Na+ symporter/sodium/proline symporter [Porticoccus sp.]|jgi:SSS family solute:Na+ symporter/sodium/proline symporter